MSTIVKLKIESEKDFLNLLESLKEKKLIMGYYYMRDDIHKVTYPFEIPLEVEELLDIVFKPAVVTMFGEKIRTTLMTGLERVVKET
jgi:hypothetical protein